MAAPRHAIDWEALSLRLVFGALAAIAIVWLNASAMALREAPSSVMSARAWSTASRGSGGTFGWPLLGRTCPVSFSIASFARRKCSRSSAGSLGTWCSHMWSAISCPLLDAAFTACG